MSYPHVQLNAVPTNIITGFLGVGKTTAILNLLKSKPPEQRWAILVNEFGEVGIDGALYQGQHSEDNGVFIREIPGGCMCCAAGLPMQIGLNQLLARAKPDRLLIEPTGLGHPKEVLEVLSAEHYRETLDIQKCITLVDARKLADPRYTQNEIFNQQIDIADTIIGNKADLYRSNDYQTLCEYIQQRRDDSIPVVKASQGQIDPQVLYGASRSIDNKHQHYHAGHDHNHDQAKINIIDQPMPEHGYLVVKNSGQGMNSIGWRFSPDKVFHYEQFYHWISGLDVERAKAVVITDKGIFGYNLASEALTEVELDEYHESRLEVIADQLNEAWESEVLNCLSA